MDALPPYCFVGMEIWRAVVPLLCFELVEVHLPDRVMRQFRMRQDIPDHPNTRRDMHAIDRRGRTGADWSTYHAGYIELWSQRMALVFDGEIYDRPMSSRDPYMVWYRRITRLHIGNPSRRAERGYSGVGGTMDSMVCAVKY